MEMKQTDFPKELFPVMMLAIAVSPCMIDNKTSNSQENVFSKLNNSV